jgi:hypothetical protein
MDAFEDAIRTGRIPYTYTYDVWSGLYFGAAIMFIAFVFALSQAITRRAIG